MGDQNSGDDHGPTGSPGVTSLHVHRARDGDHASLEWLIQRFTPLLLANARYHLQGALRSLYDPDDLVQEVWIVALPKLAQLPDREGRYTPVLLRFLSKTLVNKIGNLLQKHVLGKPRVVGDAKDGEARPAIELVADHVTGLLTRLVRAEVKDSVTACLDELSPRDREMIVLRGIEQNSYREISVILGVDPSVLPMRYRRALARLRKQLSGSVFEEFVEE